MGIGPDIAQVLNELGSEVRIIKHDGSDPVIEYIDYEVSTQASSPFLTQFMLDCTLIYNTQARPGDIVQMVDDGEYFILAAANKTRFEQSVVTMEGILYRCNLLGSIKERVETRDPNTLELSVSWQDVISDEPVLLTGMIDNYEITKEDYGMFTEENLNLHISGSVNVKRGMRFQVKDSDEVYQIHAVEKRRLNNVSICRVSTDTRE